MSKGPVSNITVTNNVALVTIDNIPGQVKLTSEIFNLIAREQINIDMISQTPPFGGTISISFSMPADQVIHAAKALNSMKKQIPALRVDVDADNTKISIFGEEMKNVHGVAATLFSVLAESGVEIKLVTTSEVDISYLIYEKDEDRAIEAIKNAFDL